MIILLDENFPLRFYDRLQKEGFSAENILLTQRAGTSVPLDACLPMGEAVTYEYSR